MDARKVFWLTVLGLLIGGADQYYQVHLGGPYGFQYWLGLGFAALVPVGSYFIGLAQPRVSQTFNAPVQPYVYGGANLASLQKRIAAMQADVDRIHVEAEKHKAVLDRVENPLGVRPWPYTPHLGDKS